ncbi:MAG: hypothetical protein ACRDOK_06580 [Streptosporangiaceae bacterium]
MSAPHASGDGHHERQHGRGLLARLTRLARPHAHEPAAKVDAAMETSAAGLRALWISLAGLGCTAALQAAIAALSGSIALLGDTLHNAADALTALPLGAAGVAAGWNWADPAVGPVITVAIVAVLWQAGREICRRPMDAVVPALTDQAERTLRATAGTPYRGCPRPSCTPTLALATAPTCTWSWPNTGNRRARASRNSPTR